MFYLVCAYDQYYPKHGLGNIVLATNDKRKAEEKVEELKEDGDHDYVDMYTSDELPWG